MHRLLISAVLMLLIAAAPPATADDAVPQSMAALQMSFAPLVKRSAPAVVNVYAQRVQEQRSNGLFDDPFFRRFFGDGGSMGGARKRVQNSLGSGVLVDPSGIIVTNHHVIGTDSDIKVVLADRREFDAKVLLAVGKGKSQIDKRETLKRKTADREIDRALRDQRKR